MLLGWLGVMERAFKQGILRRSAAGFREPRPVCLHHLFFFQPAERLPQDLCRSDMRRHDDPIMHPLPFPAHRDDTGAAEVSQVTRDLRLRAAQNLNKIADTNLLVAN